MLTKFIDTVVPNVSPLQGNSIENDERVSFAKLASTSIGNHVEAADWSDSIITRCRFDSTAISKSSFERVAIVDCDLSGVTFSHCLLRDCLIMGVKAQFHLALDNCILDRVFIARSRIDRIDVHNSKISEVNFLGIESTELNFYQCQAHRRKGQVTFEECDLTKVIGLEEMERQGVAVHVDTPMWRDLGDYYLRERGIKQLEPDAEASYDKLDQLADSLV